jgi:hypothetical protein
MEFFNRKEEVIDIQLTQYGKHLLSKGKFRPVFYAFYDDDVIYDVKFTNGDGENQKVIEDRIKSTPRIKSQYSFSGRELKTNKVDTGTCKGQMSDCNKLQVSKEKHYGLGIPLGTSEMNSHKHPAWSVNFLKGALSGSSPYSRSTNERVEFAFLSDDVSDYYNSESDRNKYIDLKWYTGQTYRLYFMTGDNVYPPSKPFFGNLRAISIDGLSTKESIADRFKTTLATYMFKVFTAKIDSNKVTVLNKKYGPVKNHAVSGLSSAVTMEQKEQGKTGIPKFLPIPQLDIKLKTKVGVSGVLGGETTEEVPTSFMYDLPSYEDGTKIYFKSEQLILELVENNAPLLMENVDIEVFKVEEDENGIEELLPLMFQKPIDFIVDNLLLDGKEILNAYKTSVKEEGIHMVNYFLDLAVDKEIDIDVTQIDLNAAIKGNYFRDRNEEEPCDDDGDNIAGV